MPISTPTFVFHLQADAQLPEGQSLELIAQKIAADFQTTLSGQSVSERLGAKYRLKDNLGLFHKEGSSALKEANINSMLGFGIPLNSYRATLVFKNRTGKVAAIHTAQNKPESMGYKLGTLAVAVLKFTVLLPFTLFNLLSQAVLRLSSHKERSANAKMIKNVTKSSYAIEKQNRRDIETKRHQEALKRTAVLSSIKGQGELSPAAQQAVQDVRVAAVNEVDAKLDAKLAAYRTAQYTFEKMLIPALQERPAYSPAQQEALNTKVQLLDRLRQLTDEQNQELAEPDKVPMKQAAEHARAEALLIRYSKRAPGQRHAPATGIHTAELDAKATKIAKKDGKKATTRTSKKANAPSRLRARNQAAQTHLKGKANHRKFR